MSWRRRDLAKIAAVALAAGCRPKDQPSAYSTVREGPNVDMGHLLRTGELGSRSIDAREEVDVLVVGGGVAGLSAALELERLGRTPTILELEPLVGGTARGSALQGHAHPLGAHYLPAPHPRNTELIELLDRMGLVRRHGQNVAPEYYPSHICAAPVERHFQHGQWFPGLYPFDGQTQAESDEWERFIDHLRSLDRDGADGRAHFQLPLHGGSEALRHLDALSFATYLDQQGFKSERLRWVTDYSCRDDYGCRAADTSAYAGLHHFLCRGLEEDHDRGLLVFPGGNGELVERLVSIVQAKVRTKHMVYAFDAARAHASVFDGATDRCLSLKASAIVWAAPSFILEAIAGRRSRTRTYSPWLVATLVLDEAPGGLGAPLAWDNVAVDRPDLGYVYDAHQLPRTVTGPKAAITFYEALVDDDPKIAREWLLAQEPAALGARALERLAFMHPSLPNRVQAMSVTPWGHAMVRPTPGSLFGTQPLDFGERVFQCSTDTAGVALFEEAFYAGTRAAQQAAQVST